MPRPREEKAVRGDVTARPVLVGIGLVVSAVLPGFLTAAVAVEIRRDFPLTNPELGLAVGMSYAVATLCSSPAGRLIDRIGPVSGARLAAATAAASMIGVAALAHSAVVLIGLLAFAGVSNAVSAPAASAFIGREVRPARQGFGLGVQQAGAPVGALLAGVALPVIAVPAGWRWAFAAGVVVPLFTVVGVHGRPRAAAITTPPAPPLGGRELAGVRLLALAAALANAAAGGMVAFLVLFAVEAGLSPAAGGLLLAGTSLAAALARIAFGAAADRRSGDPLTPVVRLLCVGAVGYVVLASSVPAGVVAGALVAGGIGWGWAGLMTLAVVRERQSNPGGAVGIAMTGIYAGAGGGPLLIGLLAGTTSFTTAWLAAAALALGAARTVTLARRRLHS
jgi:MFS family permease